jgi:D-alanyl-D-alanine carboxypeptidase/D-alanyl-D-alanine-endopeptidase (penicillin-binding protein 4)
MKRYLEIRGISVGGQILTDHQPYEWDDAQFKLLDTHESIPLSQMMKQMQKESDNFYAEMLLKTLGAKKFNTQGTTELGIQAVKEFMHGFGLDSTKVSMRDGSGLSSATIISASNLNRLLVNMQHHTSFDVYYNSLAVSGTDGTLGHRMLGSALQGMFNGKTGYISGIRALSGYLNTSSGQRLMVTITTNNYTVQTSVVDRVHERILEYYYSNY